LTLAADVFFAFDKDSLNVATAVTVAGLAALAGGHERHALARDPALELGLDRGSDNPEGRARNRRVTSTYDR
jgi:outer membrane protein OmpA-like peptidoglycan-associated protein